MPPSALWEISVQTTLEAADAIGELLTRIFGPSTSAYTDFDTGDTCVSLILKRAPGRRADWRRQLREGLGLIRRCGLEIGKGTVGSRRLPRRDWAESWKRHFHPLEVSPRLLIRPSWSRKRPRKGQRVLVLDPGLSFGTGQHPTTEFCLREIARFRGAAQPQSFLDLGTGSGILALGAAALGYDPVEACDFDPVAVRIARANARRNRLDRRVRFERVDVSRMPARPKSVASLVCANLLTPLLLAERRRIIARVAPGGRLVLAGILRKEFPAVLRAYEQAGLRVVTTEAKGEWKSGTFAASE